MGEPDLKFSVRKMCYVELANSPKLTENLRICLQCDFKLTSF